MKGRLTSAGTLSVQADSSTSPALDSPECYVDKPLQLPLILKGISYVSESSVYLLARFNLQLRKEFHSYISKDFKLTKQWQPLLTSGSTGSRHLATRAIYYVYCVNLYSVAKRHFKMPSVLYHLFFTEAPLYAQKPSTACTAISGMVLEETIF